MVKDPSYRTFPNKFSKLEVIELHSYWAVAHGSKMHAEDNHDDRLWKNDRNKLTSSPSGTITISWSRTSPRRSPWPKAWRPHYWVNERDRQERWGGRDCSNNLGFVLATSCLSSSISPTPQGRASRGCVCAPENELVSSSVQIYLELLPRYPRVSCYRLLDGLAFIFKL